MWEPIKKFFHIKEALKFVFNVNLFSQNQTQKFQLEPVEKETFLANMFAILNFESERNVKKLRQPVTRDKWVTEPAVVNAFYNPNKNDIGKAQTFNNNIIQWQHWATSIPSMP